jgi:hypothetical protein
MHVKKMKPDQIEIMRKNINFITKKLNKKQTVELLMTFFEIPQMPEIIAIDRQMISIEGFILLKKRIFKFEITFIPESNKAQMILSLQYGKQKISCSQEIEISENKEELEIYLSETKQYLFSIYF